MSASDFLGRDTDPRNELSVIQAIITGAIDVPESLRLKVEEIKQTWGDRARENMLTAAEEMFLKEQFLAFLPSVPQYGPNTEEELLVYMIRQKDPPVIFAKKGESQDYMYARRANALAYGMYQPDPKKKAVLLNTDEYNQDISGIRRPRMGEGVWGVVRKNFRIIQHELEHLEMTIKQISPTVGPAQEHKTVLGEINGLLEDACNPRAQSDSISTNILFVRAETLLDYLLDNSTLESPKFLASKGERNCSTV